MIVVIIGKPRNHSTRNFENDIRYIVVLLNNGNNACINSYIVNLGGFSPLAYMFLN